MNETTGSSSPLPEGRADGAACGECQRTAEAMRIASAGDWSGMVSELLGYLHEAGTDGLPLDAVTVHDYVRELKERYVTAPVRAALAVPVVAVPEAGERACDCPTNEAGDIRCHVCREYVNKRCWNCHTPRGEGPCPNPAPAALTDAEKAEMVAALDDLNGPVGVQPEPAEPSEWADPQLERQMKAAWKEADRHRAQPAGPGIPAHCGVCFTAWPCEVAQDRPAVPVVHPEPGDRAEDDDPQRLGRWVAALLAAMKDGRNNLDPVMALADAEVAAAVAAVRADLAREVADWECTKAHPDGEDHQCEGFNEAIEIAAALIRGRS